MRSGGLWLSLGHPPKKDRYKGGTHVGTKVLNRVMRRRSPNEGSLDKGPQHTPVERDPPIEVLGRSLNEGMA